MAATPTRIPIPPRPHFESRILCRKVCIDEIPDLTEDELDILREELGETQGTLKARIDEAAALYGTPDQISPTQYGRMRFKHRILTTFSQRLQWELNKRNRVVKAQQTTRLERCFVDAARVILDPEVFVQVLNAAQERMTIA